MKIDHVLATLMGVALIATVGFVIWVGSLGNVAMAATPAEAAPELIGRYQITATSVINGNGMMAEAHVYIFKVDTVTGKVWKHEDSNGGWAEIK